MDVEPLDLLDADRALVLGGATGRDGIRGATFSSATMDATTGEVAGASVQIGDPIVEKLLIDVLIGAEDLYSSITDCGAGVYTATCRGAVRLVMSQTRIGPPAYSSEVNRYRSSIVGHALWQSALAYLPWPSRRGRRGLRTS